MLPTFENHTKPLTEYEINVLIPVLIKGLKLHVGKENAITSHQICLSLKKGGFKISDVTLRRCIKYIQFNQLLRWVIADESGFFLTSDIELVKKQIESLRGREEAIRAVRISLEKSITL